MVAMKLQQLVRRTRPIAFALGLLMKLIFPIVLGNGALLSRKCVAHTHDAVSMPGNAALDEKQVLFRVDPHEP
jgi:hypothetical protein